jgi:hypothetical protein
MKSFQATSALKATSALLVVKGGEEERLRWREGGGGGGVMMSLKSKGVEGHLCLMN